MRLGDLARDVEAETKALIARPDLAAREGVEKTIHRFRRNSVAGVAYRELELIGGFRGDRHGLAWGSIGQRVSQEVREKLANAPRINLERLRQVEFGLDDRFRVSALQ